MTKEPMIHPIWLAVTMMLTMIIGVLPILDFQILAQDYGPAAHIHHMPHDGQAHESHVLFGQWEGSPEGIAYSEFNHALAGIGVVMVGISEFRTGLGWTTLAWLRFLLPVGMLTSGVYLLIWSDHDAWPIGRFSLAQTFSGDDPEMLLHKIFALLLLGIGLIEWRIRRGRLQGRRWSLALPIFAVVGGLLLFLHMHGPHPAAQRIAMHHFLMGALALGAGWVRFVGEYVENHQAREERRTHRSVFVIIWSVLILFIGIQLLGYSET